MATDRFFIAPFDSNSGLQTVNACFGIITENTKGCFMELPVKKTYRKRRDIIPLLGRRFGKLTVIKLIEKAKHRGAHWLCLCDCGKETVAQGGNLRAGERVSCGCKAEDKISETGVSKIFSNYRTGAIRFNRTFNLSREEFKKLILDDCFYCGIKPAQILRRQLSRKLQLTYNGVDRVDSSIGYEPGNCVTACMYCNRAKSNLPLEEFKDHIKRIYLWLKIGS